MMLKQKGFCLAFHIVKGSEVSQNYKEALMSIGQKHLLEGTLIKNKEFSGNTWSIWKIVIHTMVFSLLFVVAQKALYN